MATATVCVLAVRVPGGAGARDLEVDRFDDLEQEQGIRDLRPSVDLGDALGVLGLHATVVDGRRRFRKSFASDPLYDAPVSHPLADLDIHERAADLLTTPNERVRRAAALLAPLDDAVRWLRGLRSSGI